MMIEYLTEQECEFGVPNQVAEGVWWIRLPIDLALDHVNVYVLQNAKGLTLVDTGLDQPESQRLLSKALEHPTLSGQRLNQVIVTHYHPDHIGLAGRLCCASSENLEEEKQDVQLVTSETCYQAAQELRAEQDLLPAASQIRFMQEAGLPTLELESFRRRKRIRYRDRVGRLPSRYQPIFDRQAINIGGRTWSSGFGQGHARDHLMLCSDDGLALVGDQILPNVSPNLSVHYSAPDADCIRPWLESCHQFQQQLDDQVLCLPGHQRPFFGGSQRCKQLIANCQQLIDRTIEALRRPQTIVDLLPKIYRRDFSDHQQHLYIGEMRAVLNHLYQSSLIIRRKNAQGTFVWRKV